MPSLQQQPDITRDDALIVIKKSEAFIALIFICLKGYLLFLYFLCSLSMTGAKAPVIVPLALILLSPSSSKEEGMVGKEEGMVLGKEEGMVLHMA